MSLASDAAVASATHVNARRLGRLHDLDRAKGVAILLVVVGHLVARRTPAGVTWYDPLRIAIYLFHMPFFMYLSGYVTFLSGAARTPLTEWTRLVCRRAERLLLPFLLFGLAILAAKLIISRFAHIDNVPASLGSGLLDMVWNTERSPAVSIWYIGVLFVYCIATPLLLRLDGSRALLAIAAVLLYIAPLPPNLYLNRIGTFFIFFVAGGLAADAGESWRRWMETWHWWLVPVFAVIVWAVASGTVHIVWTPGLQGFPYKWWMLAAGLLSMPVVHGLLQSGASANGFFTRLGRYSLVIYLLNTIFIGATKAVLLHFGRWDDSDFLPLACALLVAGVAGPILTKMWFLRRIPLLDRMTA